MKILMIGASGQLARSLAHDALQKNQTLVAVGRPGFDLAGGTGIDQAFADVSPDLVINASAYTAVDKAEEETELAFALNDTGPGLLAIECERHNIPLIHVSTDYVFDGENNEPYLEDDLTAPTGVYGRSKRAGELRVMENCTRHIILRTAWVHSSYGQNFVKTMLRLAGDRDELNVVADQIGNPTYAPHLASAILNIAGEIFSKPSADLRWGVYHAAGTGQASWCDLAREIFEQSARLGGPSAIVHPITTDQYPTPVQSSCEFQA